MKYLLLFTTLIFAAEMEVDGNLKVTGTVDANGNPITNVGAALSMTDAINGNVLQSALRDDGVYEFVYFTAQFHYAFYLHYANPFEAGYREVGDIYDQGWTSDWLSKINELSAQGWKINNTFPSIGEDFRSMYVLYELKRKLSDD